MSSDPGNIVTKGGGNVVVPAEGRSHKYLNKHIPASQRSTLDVREHSRANEGGGYQSERLDFAGARGKKKKNQTTGNNSGGGLGT